MKRNLYGSMGELWRISFPLMLSLMSVSLMFFMDRLLLSRYSLDALNAASNAGMLIQFMQFWCISTVSIAEVFVGRYNGAGQREKMGKPVWQMIWFSLGSFAWFVPLAFWAGPLFFDGDPLYQMENEYFSCLLFFGPVAALAASLSAFYIGQGRVKFVTCVMIGTNLINLLLDCVFIWGWHSIPALGVIGAALATGLAQVMQVVILFADFLRKENRDECGTGRWQWNFKSLSRSLNMGLPNAVAHSLELMAWVLIFHLMTRLGDDYLTVVTVSQSICFLFSFITEGVSKGATAIASNLIGSQQHDRMWKLLRSGLKLYFFVFLLLGFFFVGNPEWLLSLFLGPWSDIPPQTQQTLTSALFWVWIFFLFDGINWFMIGLLTAAGDTRFIMKVGGIGPWLVALVPIYFLVFQWGAEPHVTWILIAFYVMSSSVLYMWRFQTEKWKEVAVV